MCHEYRGAGVGVCLCVLKFEVLIPLWTPDPFFFFFFFDSVICCSIVDMLFFRPIFCWFFSTAPILTFTKIDTLNSHALLFLNTVI